VLAVIPARGGSKGIVGKNYRRVCGMPLVEHSIEACILAGVRPVVSTDCPIIRDISLEAGAEVVGRPDELSGDHSPSELAVVDAINQLGYDGTYTLMVQCTSPLTQPEDINGVEELLGLGYDSVFTASRFHGFIWESGKAVNHDEGYRPMRQDVCQYMENGAIYGFDTIDFLAYKNRFFGNIGMYEMPAERSLEIDEPWHLILAETMINKNIHVNSGG